MTGTLFGTGWPRTSTGWESPTRSSSKSCDTRMSTTTTNIYVKMVSQDATVAMKTLETNCAATVQQKRVVGAAEGRETPMDREQEISLSERYEFWRRGRDSNPRYRC